VRNPNEFGELRRSSVYRLRIWLIRIFAASFAAALLMCLVLAAGLLPDEVAPLVVAPVIIGAGTVVLLIVTVGKVSQALREQGAMRSIDAQMPYLRNLIFDLLNLK